MPEKSRNGFEKLDQILNKMLVDETFRKKMAASGVDVLEAVARLINAPAPRLSVAAKHIIHGQMLDAIPSDSAQETSVKDVAVQLLNNEHPELPVSAKNRILDRLLSAVPEQNESQARNDRILARLLEPQQQLQADRLVESDEALELAKSNPDPVIQVAVALRTVASPTLSREAKARIEARILPQKKERKPILSPDFAGSLQRVVASVAILIFLAIFAIPPASAQSLPGDLLYPVKRGLESVQLHLNSSLERRAFLHLDYSNERLDELHELMDSGRYHVRGLNAAFSNLEQAMALAQETNLLEDDTFQSRSVATLNALNSVVDDFQVAQGSDFDAGFVARQLVLHDLIVQVPASDTVQSMPPAPVLFSVPDTESVLSGETADSTDDLVITDNNEVPEQVLYTYAFGLVRMRTAPGLNAEILTTIPHGEAVTQIGVSEDGLWIHVQLADGLEGWIASFLLIDVYISEPPPAPVSTIHGEGDSATSLNGGNGTVIIHSGSSSDGNGVSITVEDTNGNSTGNGHAFAFGAGNGTGISDPNGTNSRDERSNP